MSSVKLFLHAIRAAWLTTVATAVIVVKTAAAVAVRAEDALVVAAAAVVIVVAALCQWKVCLSRSLVYISLFRSSIS